MSLETNKWWVLGASFDAGILAGYPSAWNRKYMIVLWGNNNTGYVCKNKSDNGTSGDD